jgi:glycerol-3-phosphate dehydrogenase (NAD(P)+)
VINLKIAILGTGLYSTALTYQLQKRKDNDLYLWTEQESLITKFNKSRKFEFLSKKIKFDSNVFLSNDYEKVLEDASVIFILVSSQYFKETLSNIKPFYKKNTPIFVGTKGMDLEKIEFFSDYTRKFLKCNSYTFFAGPTFATDLIQENIAYLSFAGSNKIGYKKLDRILPESFEYHFINDLHGLELCSVFKNVYAIGSGILNGLKVSDSIYYGYLTKMIQELQNIITKMLGSEKTILTYGAIGDLLMTSNSKTSRNFTLGFKIGSQNSKEELKKYLEENTIEGYVSLQKIPTLLNTWKIKSCLLDKIYQIVIEDANPKILYHINETENKETF